MTSTSSTGKVLRTLPWVAAAAWNAGMIVDANSAGLTTTEFGT